MCRTMRGVGEQYLHEEDWYHDCVSNLSVPVRVYSGFLNSVKCHREASVCSAAETFHKSSNPLMRYERYCHQDQQLKTAHHES